MLDAAPSVVKRSIVTALLLSVACSYGPGGITAFGGGTDDDLVGAWGGESSLIVTSYGAQLEWSDLSGAPEVVRCRSASIGPIRLDSRGRFQAQGRLWQAVGYAPPGELAETLSGSANATFVGTVSDGRMILSIVRPDVPTIGPEVLFLGRPATSTRCP
jgi:hypothetical protein